MFIFQCKTLRNERVTVRWMRGEVRSTIYYESLGIRQDKVELRMQQSISRSTLDTSANQTLYAHVRYERPTSRAIVYVTE